MVLLRVGHRLLLSRPRALLPSVVSCPAPWAQLGGRRDSPAAWSAPGRFRRAAPDWGGGGRGRGCSPGEEARGVVPGGPLVGSPAHGHLGWGRSRPLDLMLVPNHGQRPPERQRGQPLEANLRADGETGRRGGGGVWGGCLFFCLQGRIPLSVVCRRARTHENRSARPCVAVAGGSRSRPRNSPAPHTRLSSTGSLCTRKTINKPEWALPPAPRGEGCAGPLVWMEGSGAAAAPGSWNALAPGEEPRTAARRPEVHACHAALRQVLWERKRDPLRDAPLARPAVRVECWVSAAGEGPSDSHGGPRALVPAGPGQGVLGGASSWTGGATRSRVRV
nr:uncharacterized protein LOC102148365 isoform X4 [Equus caballus]XP_023489628.1 uncharacterized protein LOC102148365 isoform X4 [Equus caballus]XP_023489629.1 uncharacterized protein LOC102148365 isoform X4 [Equus caballus]XP_023489630.1 uncharacterized protein LOC102148365 isoform X4 [Equus caballus]XP_023489631.1 uncharacterized protein LOC102148365 isoform X4 [Equus caballus]